MAVHIQPPPTTTRRGSRPAKKTSSWATQSMYPQLSAISHSPIRSIIKTPVKPAFGMKMFAPTSKRARKGFSGFKRGAPRRFRPAVGVAKRTKSKGEMFGRMGMMRVMLPMIMANEGEGLMVLFLAQMMDVRKTSPFLKLHILSGRLGKIYFFLFFFFFYRTSLLL